MADPISTKHWPQELQNQLTPGAVVVMRAWLAEACQLNGADWSAQGLMDSLATYVVIGMDDKSLGAAPRYFDYTLAHEVLSEASNHLTQEAAQ